MAFPDVVTREEWLEARKRLLVKEKQATRERDALNAERRRLPMVAVDKEYVFEGPDGKVALADLFGDSRQLIVQHVMFGPDWDAACPGCTAGINETSDGMIAHLRTRDTNFVLVSRAPLEKLRQYQAKMGWTIPWYSSYGSDFNYDYQATADKERQQFVYNYKEQPDLLEDEDSTELPGFSFFLRDGDQVFHTYSTWARGTDTVGSAYSFLDLTALGRSGGVGGAQGPRAQAARRGPVVQRLMREDEFTELAAAYQAELRAHCYRILGSVHDAEDALQEALVRAWKGIDRFEGRASVRSWLYAIATNTALDIARHRSRREFAVDLGAPAELGAELDPPLTELPWLEPFPDRWLTPAGEPTPGGALRAAGEHRAGVRRRRAAPAAAAAGRAAAARGGRLLRRGDSRPARHVGARR